MNIPNRIKLIVTAATYTIITGLNVTFGVLDHVVIASIVVVGTAWSFGFDLKFKEIVPFLLLAFVYVTSMSVIIKGSDGMWSYGLIAVSGMGLYLLLLTLNILNVATIKRIPLKKPALSALYLFGILLFFAYAYLVVSSEGWGINTTMLWYWLSVCSYGFGYLHIISSRALQLESLLFAVIAAEIILLPAFFPATPVFMAIFMVGWLFIILGVLQHNSEKTLTRAITREYMSAGLIMSVMYFLL